jgi:hypothetical protein
VYDSNCSEPEPEGRTAAAAGPDVPAVALDPDPVAAACGTYVAATPAAGTAAAATAGRSAKSAVAASAAVGACAAAAAAAAGRCPGAVLAAGAAGAAGRVGCCSGMCRRAFLTSASCCCKSISLLSSILAGSVQKCCIDVCDILELSR